MAYYKFETIKKKAKEHFLHKSGGRRGMFIVDDTTFLAMYAAMHSRKWESPQQILDQWIDYGLKLIDQWDIRQVKTLIELFPSCVPKAYQERTPLCDMDEKGDWCVCYN